MADLFDDVTGEQLRNGHTDFRCIYLLNDNQDSDAALDPQIFFNANLDSGGTPAAATKVDIALDPEAGVNETAQTVDDEEATPGGGNQLDNPRAVFSGQAFSAMIAFSDYIVAARPGQGELRKYPYSVSGQSITDSPESILGSQTLNSLGGLARTASGILILRRNASNPNTSEFIRYATYDGSGDIGTLQNITGLAESTNSPGTGIGYADISGDPKMIICRGNGVWIYDYDEDAGTISNGNQADIQQYDGCHIEGTTVFLESRDESDNDRLHIWRGEINPSNNRFVSVLSDLSMPVITAERGQRFLTRYNTTDPFLMNGYGSGQEDLDTIQMDYAADGLITWSPANGLANALSTADIPATQAVPIWIRRTVTATASGGGYTGDKLTLKARAESGE